MTGARRWTIFFGVLAWLLVVSSTAMSLQPRQIVNPQDRGEWVSDVARLLTPEEQAQLNRIIDALEADTGVEVAVVTVPSVGAPTTKDFATALFNHWGIGKAGEDNGLLIVVDDDNRRLEMETGYGLEEILTDGWLAMMQRDEMVPHLRRDHYGPALIAGMEAIDDRVRRHMDPEGAGARQAVTTVRSRPVSDEARSRWWLWGVLLLVVGAAGVVEARRRHYQCPECAGSMKLVEGLRASDHLSPGQLAEREVGSKTFRVYLCSCGYSDAVDRPVRSYQGLPCPSCGFSAVEYRSEVSQAATYDEPGERLRIEDCQHCDFEVSKTEVIPSRRPIEGADSGFRDLGGRAPTRQHGPNRPRRGGRGGPPRGRGGGGGGGGGRSGGGGGFGGGRSGGGGSGSSF